MGLTFLAYAPLFREDEHSYLLAGDFHPFPLGSSLPAAHPVCNCLCCGAIIHRRPGKIKEYFGVAVSAGACEWGIVICTTGIILLQSA